VNCFCARRPRFFCGTSPWKIPWKTTVNLLAVHSKIALENRCVAPQSAYLTAPVNAPSKFSPLCRTKFVRPAPVNLLDAPQKIRPWNVLCGPQ
jgi:hypothetical protein